MQHFDSSTQGDSSSEQHGSIETPSSGTQGHSSSEQDEPIKEEIYLGEEKMEEGDKDSGAAEEPSSKVRDFFHKRRDSQEAVSAQFEAFKKAFDAESENDAKLQCAIHFMEASLGEGATPHFRSFWEVRRLCFSLFKENISPPLRSELWAKYSHLSKEARRLKEALDEQSAFAVEQIDMAILALEKEISQFSLHMETEAFPLSFVFPRSLKEQVDLYRHLQKQLNLLNAHASRINELRKELLKTEMRVRNKNQFFQRLSAAGDQVFPKRKELIRQVSQQFTEDIDQFIHEYFGEKAARESLYVLREEIKALQSLAKILTLNTHSFTQTRTRLSECWDSIKVEEKERKKERAQQRLIFKQNAGEIEKRIQWLKERLDKGEEGAADFQKHLEEIVVYMRKVELGRDELKALREALAELRKMIQDKFKSKEEVRQQEEQERNRQKREKYHSLKDQGERLLREHESQDGESLLIHRDALLTEIHGSSLSKHEKQDLERVLKPLRDVITEKREKAVLALSEDDRQALQQVQEILKQRKERRQEIKNQLEFLRKGASSSNLDFEKAISYTTQISDEKKRLEKANQAIQEIEQKMTQLQAKVRHG